MRAFAEISEREKEETVRSRDNLQKLTFILHSQHVAHRWSAGSWSRSIVGVRLKVVGGPQLIRKVLDFTSDDEYEAEGTLCLC